MRNKINYRQLALYFTHMTAKNITQPHSQLFMTSIYYSWQRFHKINQKSLNKDIGHEVRTISQFMDIMLKNKVVHLSIIHVNTFEIPPIFFPQANCNFILQKEVVLLTINFQSYWEKSPLLLYVSHFLYKKKKNMVGLPKVTFGLPNPFVFPTFQFSKKPFTIY